MTRWHKRKSDSEISGIVRKAKVDMIRWVEALKRDPTEEEARIWQAGYLAGINRATSKD